MATIEIRNPDAAIAKCGEIIGKVAQAKATAQKLDGTLSKVKSQWETTGLDKQSFTKELETQITKLETINAAVEKLARVVENYARQNKATSSKSA